MYWDRNCKTIKFAVDDVLYELDDFILALMAACGNKITSAYFELLNTSIGLALYHLDTFRDLQSKLNSNSAEDKAKSLGISLDEFE